METVDACEAKTHLPKRLDRVLKGERITITRHGVPVAVLQPFIIEDQVDIDKTVSALRRFRKNRKLSISVMIDKGRR